jgi:5-methylcytosine-specific restriction endonuclease McrA
MTIEEPLQGTHALSCYRCGKGIYRPTKKGDQCCFDCRDASRKESSVASKKRREFAIRESRANGCDRVISEEIFNRDQWRCRMCGCRVEKVAAAKHEATVDHIVPLSKGGEHSPSNCQTACRDCNVKKYTS